MREKWAFVSKSQWFLFLCLLLGNAALALGPWCVRLTDTGPVSAGFWRLFLALPVFAMLARANGQNLLGIDRRALFLTALGALTFAGDLASWHIGIGMTRLGNATLFGNAGSIVLMFGGFVAARVWPRLGDWLAIFCALLGAAILMGQSADISARTLHGDLFSLAAGLFYAVYLLSLQDVRKNLGAFSLLVWVSVFACPVLLTFAIFRGEQVWPGAAGWEPVLMLALISQIIGQGLLVFAMRHFSALVIGLALLTQPAISALSGYLAFGEILGAWDIAGMVLLGGALVLARMKSD